MAPCAAGEDDVVIAGTYSANLEIACADAQPVELPAPLDAPTRVDTPGARTIEAISALLGVPDGAQMKSFPVVVDDGRFVLVLVRGDHQISETKLRNHTGAPWRPAGEEEIREKLGPPGSLGPVGASVDVLLDAAIRDDDGASYTTGANEEGVHLRGVRPGRDFAFERADVREVVLGDTVDGVAVRIEPAIEIGNIFQLGTRYSEPLGATYLDQDGKQQPIVMGSYGIGPARIAAAAVEQYGDDKGIAWPKAIAPWAVELVVLGKAGTPEREAGDKLYAELQAAGIEVLVDDRDGGPGAKFADAELLGCPVRLTLGRRSLESGVLEAQTRRGLVDHEGGIPIDGAAEAVQELWATLP
jgi:prolyl-tRNA synthetase